MDETTVTPDDRINALADLMNQTFKNINERIAIIQGHLATEIDKRKELSDRVRGRGISFITDGMSQFIELQSHNILALQEQNSELKRRVTELEESSTSLKSQIRDIVNHKGDLR